MPEIGVIIFGILVISPICWLLTHITNAVCFWCDQKVWINCTGICPNCSGDNRRQCFGCETKAIPSTPWCPNCDGDW